MLLATTYRLKNDTEDGQKRLLQVFGNWTPPAGFEFKAHYARADGNGGIAIVEADTAAALYEATAPFTPWLDFDVVPVVEIDQSVEIDIRVYGWRDSLS